jgi:predicted transcriptional regulator
MSQTLTVRVPDELGERLDNLARQTRRSKSLYVRDALAWAIDRLEWEQGILREAEGVRSGAVKTYTSAQARQVLGLDG